MFHSTRRLGNALPSRQNAPNDDSVETVESIDGRASFYCTGGRIHADRVPSRDSKPERRSGLIRTRTLTNDRDWQVPLQPMLSIGGFIAVFLQAPGEDAYLIEVVRQAIFIRI